MKVVMPIATLHGEAIEAMFQSFGRHQFTLVPVHEDDYDYWRLFVQLWEADEPFVLVEHDIVVRRDTIETLEYCPASWCGFVYHEALGEPVAGLGCTKITPQPGRVNLRVMPPLVWQNVDSAVTGLMTSIGEVRHEHHPYVGHLNPKVMAMRASVP